MNILVHDDPPAVGRLVRAALAGRRHRASLAASPEEALRKLDTGLFDALVIGAGGASRELADKIESDWPELPIVLAGVDREIPCVEPIVAVLPAPLRLESLRAAVRTLQSRFSAPSTDIEAVLIAAGISIPGRVVARRSGSLLFEPASAVAPVESAHVTLRCEGADLEADLVFADAAPSGGARVVGVRLSQNPNGGVAC